MSHSQNQGWNGKCYGYLERHANPPVTSQFLGFSVSHLPHFWVWKTISDFRQFFFLGVLPRSMSSHDPLQRFFRRLLPVGRFGHGGVHDHTCGHNSSVVGSLKMPTEAMENGIILDDSYWTWWFSMATSKKKLREKPLGLIIIFWTLSFRS